jgi:glutamate--cysteine ligase
VQAAIHGLQYPETLPSARVLKAITEEYDGSFGAFARAQSVVTRQAMLDMPLAAEMQAHFEALARESWDTQRKIEAADTMPFDIYLQEYLSPKRLGVAKA